MFTMGYIVVYLIKVLLFYPLTDCVYGFYFITLTACTNMIV